MHSVEGCHVFNTTIQEAYHAQHKEELMLFSMVEKMISPYNAQDVHLIPPFKIYTGEMKVHEIALWVEENHLPKVFELDQLSLHYLKEHHRPFMMLFLIDSPQNDQDIKTYMKSARKHDFEMSLAFCIFAESGFCRGFLEMLMYKPKEGSAVFILEDLDDINRKFTMRIGQTLDMRKLQIFWTKWINHDMTPLVRSEKEPEWDDLDYIHRIVGTNFVEKVLEGKDDALVLFTGDNCRYCYVLEKLYANASRHLYLNSRINFYTINTTDNEVEGIERDLLSPMVFFYRARNKAKPIDFTKLRDIKRVLAELKLYTSYKWEEPLRIRSDL